MCVCIYIYIIHAYIQVAKDSGPWEHCTIAAEVYNFTHCIVRAREVHCVLMKEKRGPYWYVYVSTERL